MEFTKSNKKSFLSDEYVPLNKECPPWEECPCGYDGECADDTGLVPAREACNFPNCNCEPEVCENMPYVEKK